MSHLGSGRIVRKYLLLFAFFATALPSWGTSFIFNFPDLNTRTETFVNGSGSGENITMDCADAGQFLGAPCVVRQFMSSPSIIGVDSIMNIASDASEDLIMKSRPSGALLDTLLALAREWPVIEAPPSNGTSGTW
jgi:hypothetical protein